MSDTGDTPPGTPGPLPKQATHTINDVRGTPPGTPGPLPIPATDTINGVRHTPPCTPQPIVIPPTAIEGDAIGNPGLALADVHGTPGPPAQPATGTINEVPPSTPGPPAIPATDTINDVRGNQTNAHRDVYNINANHVTIVTQCSTSGELICFEFI